MREKTKHPMKMISTHIKFQEMNYFWIMSVREKHLIGFFLAFCP